MNQQHNEHKIEKGREAAYIESVIRPFIQAGMEKIVNKMVTSFRGGKTDHDRLVGYAAQMTALQDLLYDLEGTQRQGIIASEKELSHAAEEESNT